MNKKIGIFDSGIGGITVLNSLLDKLPNEDYVFIADEKHFPYGTKKKEELLKYSDIIVKYFISINVKIIIIACNTISSMCLSDLRLLNPDVNIIGVIEATVNEILKYNNRKILLMATDNTINSNIYKNTVEKNSNNIIFNLKTTMLAEMIEKSDPEVINLLNNYICNYKNIDLIVLGCTHYKLIIDKLKMITACDIINSSDAVSCYVEKYLRKNNMLGDKSGVVIYTTGDIDSFYKISRCVTSFDVFHINL